MELVNEFLSYAIIYVCILATAVVGAKLGIKLRKNKDAKVALDSTDNA